MLTYTEARAFYNRFGARQDSQAFYEDPAIQELLHHAEFDQATAVFELGCGTGRLANRLLAEHLPLTAHYRGVDLSTTMVRLAQGRLAVFRERAEVGLSDGSPKLAVPDKSIDRFLSTYVLDLMASDNIASVLMEAHRVLREGGKLCLVGLTYGQDGLAHLVSWGWERVHGLRPLLVGGCRPIKLVDYLTPARWRLQHRSIVTAYGIASEVIVATPSLAPEPFTEKNE